DVVRQRRFEGSDFGLALASFRRVILEVYLPSVDNASDAQLHGTPGAQGEQERGEQKADRL
ncbi:MAG: hypothetical protein ILO43_00165, partial [Clostridia bacterium]|nr:hypothetical protein [Clostridia bacterium]